ncbi:MAG: hypothetical protein HRU12_15225, partial [Phaeodactylibacter sp.]|nr:hypothetical protein [Phaeodactylibacter sp.]
PYKYAWDNGETTPTAVKLGEGEHSVTVTDRLGCEISAVVNVSRVLEELAVQIEQIKPIKCQGNKSAVLKVVAEGGEKPYTYKWSVADSPTPQLTGLLAGSYAVTVTDGNGATATTSFTVEEPAAFNVNARVVQPATANGSDGEAVATADGGVAPYQFVWSNGGATASAAGLSAGKYTVTVTDANGCPTTAEVVVVEDILPLALTIGQDEKIDCQGAAAAALSADVTGGKAPFTYQWSNGKATESIKGLPAGPYAITVTDATGAKAEANFTVEEPQALQARANQITPANTGASDGIAEVTVNGGVAPYQYVWTNGATTANIENLLAGPYTVTVTDQNNCKATAKVEVTEDIAPLEVTLELGKPVSCVDGADGEIMAVINGGKGPFAYAWSNGSTTEKQIQALAAGNYTLTVTDIAGNTANAAFTLSGPEKLKVGVEVTQEATTNESDGKAIVTATGGNGGYSYLWTSGETAAEATQLEAGMQTVTITDAKGCTSSISVEMVEDIQPLQVSIAEDQAVSCADATDGALTASIKGGKGPYTYNWSSGAQEQNATALGVASYTLTITDAQGATAEASFELSAPAALNATSKTVQPASTNNADGIISTSALGGTSPYTYSWSSGASSETVEGLAPGQYTVTVTDSKGCTATASTEVTENILPLQVSLTEVLPVNCNGGNSGAIASEVNGGKSPYTYEWSGGQDNGKAEQLTAGTYGLTVTDAVGSTATASISLQEPNALSANIMIVQPASTNAKDGKAKAIAEGGTPPYNYDWSSEIYADLADSLAPGQHTVTVTDAKGCKTEAEVSITENILPLELSLDVSAPINCNGGAGAVNAAVSGGKSPFAYAWSNGATEPQAAGLSAGTYGLTLTDAAGTTVEQEITLTQPDALTASALAVSASG